jgi:hypothetical protein
MAEKVSDDPEEHFRQDYASDSNEPPDTGGMDFDLQELYSEATGKWCNNPDGSVTSN